MAREDIPAPLVDRDSEWNEWNLVKRTLEQGADPVALGGSNGIHTIEDVFKRLAAEVPALTGLTFSKSGDQGVQVLETAEKIPLLEREKERKAKGIIVG